MTTWKICPKCGKKIIMSHHTFKGKSSLDNFKEEDFCKCSHKKEKNEN